MRSLLLVSAASQAKSAFLFFESRWKTSAGIKNGRVVGGDHRHSAVQHRTLAGDPVAAR